MGAAVHAAAPGGVVVAYVYYKEASGTIPNMAVGLYCEGSIRTSTCECSCPTFIVWCAGHHKSAALTHEVECSTWCLPCCR